MITYQTNQAVVEWEKKEVFVENLHPRIIPTDSEMLKFFKIECEEPWVLILEIHLRKYMRKSVTSVFNDFNIFGMLLKQILTK